MDLGIHGKTALVFGASGGLGGAIARALAAEGVRVVLAGRNAAALDSLRIDLEAAGATVMALPWDLSDLSVIDARVSAIETAIDAGFGPVDILINNTGGPPPTPASGQDPALWNTNFQSMVLPVIAITDRVLPGMRQRRWGRIITSTSSGVISPIPNLAISNTLRMALVGWSKTLAREVGGDGVTANIVLPGRVATARIAFLDHQKAEREARSVEAVRAESTTAIPVGRYGDPAEYGAAVAFLASTQAAYITGSVMRVDGGLISGV